ncbi:MAG: Rho termination factor N-terminal domain-containing protein, partial [bacterium]
MADDRNPSGRRGRTPPPADPRPRRRITRAGGNVPLEGDPWGPTEGNADAGPGWDDSAKAAEPAPPTRRRVSSRGSESTGTPPPPPASPPGARPIRERPVPVTREVAPIRDRPAAAAPASGPVRERGQRYSKPEPPPPRDRYNPNEPDAQRAEAGSRMGRVMSTRADTPEEQQNVARYVTRKEQEMLERESELELDMQDLDSMTLGELRDLAKDHDIQNVSGLKKQDIIMRILQTQTEEHGLLFGEGTLEILPEGYGFLRRNGYTPSPDDIYVSQSQIKRFGLRTGDFVSGQVRAPKESEKYYGLLRVEAVNGAHA